MVGKGGGKEPECQGSNEPFEGQGTSPSPACLLLRLRQREGRVKGAPVRKG